jgi:hypothetical protein
VHKNDWKTWRRSRCQENRQNLSDSTGNPTCSTGNPTCSISWH